MANYSLKDSIYKYLDSVTAVSSLVDIIGWGEMPDTAVSNKRIIYKMISDPRIPESKLRGQRWRFWICIPQTESAPKESCLTISNLMLDNLHRMQGSFGDVSIHYIDNVSNEDPFFDTDSNCYIAIQDYILKMKTLE